MVQTYEVRPVPVIMRLHFASLSSECYFLPLLCFLEVQDVRRCVCCPSCMARSYLSPFARGVLFLEIWCRHLLFKFSIASFFFLTIGPSSRTRTIPSFPFMFRPNIFAGNPVFWLAGPPQFLFSEQQLIFMGWPFGIHVSSPRHGPFSLALRCDRSADSIPSSIFLSGKLELRFFLSFCESWSFLTSPVILRQPPPFGSCPSRGTSSR